MASVSFSFGSAFDPSNLTALASDPIAFVPDRLMTVSFGAQMGTGPFTISPWLDPLHIGGFIATAALGGMIVDGINYSVNADFSDNIGVVFLDGGNGADILRGGAAADTIGGGGGNDILEGGAGGDALNGGAGVDTVSYEHAGGGVRVYLDPGDAGLLSGDAMGDTFTSIESIRGSAFDDVLVGDSGDNLLEGGGGADYFNGDGGFNTVSYYHSSAGVTVDLSTNTGSGGDAEGDYLFANIQGLLGSLHNDSLTGNGADNVIEGGVGNDIINGQAGGDTLDGGDGTDTLSHATSTAGVTVHLDGSLLSGGDAAGDAISNFENLIGSKYADSLDGTSGNNVINGGSGADTMAGGDGDDMYYVDRVGDRIVESAGGGADEVRSSISFSLAGLAEVENLTLRGSAALDAVGNAGRNILRGNAGDNHLTGGGGQDRLIGGAGADVFVFTAINDSARGATTRDFIHDFSQAQGDKIDLSAIDANVTLADDQAFAFLGIGSFTKTAGELRQTTLNGRELLEGDVNGDGKADFQIQFPRSGLVLQTSDFVL